MNELWAASWAAETRPREKDGTAAVERMTARQAHRCVGVLGPWGSWRSVSEYQPGQGSRLWGQDRRLAARAAGEQHTSHKSGRGEAGVGVFVGWGRPPQADPQSKAACTPTVLQHFPRVVRSSRFSGGLDWVAYLGSESPRCGDKIVARTSCLHLVFF